MTQTNVFDKKNSKYWLIILIVAIGFICSELYGAYVERKQLEERANYLTMQTSAKLDLVNIWSQLKKSKSVSIEDEVSFGYLGCNYSTKYVGKINGTNEYAKSTNDIDAENSLNFCPRSVESMLKYYNGEYYWIGGYVYARKTDSEDFEVTNFKPEESDEYTFAVRPAFYLDSVIKNIDDMEVTIDPKLPNIIKGKTKGEKGDNSYTFVLDEKTKNIKSMQYTLEPNGTMPRKGNITFTYESPEVIVPQALRNIFSIERVSDLLKKEKGRVNIDAEDFSIYMSSLQNAVITSYKTGNAYKSTDCSFNQTSCLGEINKIKTSITESLPMFVESKKTLCSTSTSSSAVDYSNKLHLHIYDDTNQPRYSTDYAVDITFDFDKSLYQIKQTDINITCFEGKYNTIEINKLYNRLKQEAAILSNVE